MHVRNLQAKEIKQASFDVDYLCNVLEKVSPLPKQFKTTEVKGDIVIADGGKFRDEN